VRYDDGGIEFCGGTAIAVMYASEAKVAAARAALAASVASTSAVAVSEAVQSQGNMRVDQALAALAKPVVAGTAAGSDAMKALAGAVLAEVDSDDDGAISEAELGAVAERLQLELQWPVPDAVLQLLASDGSTAAPPLLSCQKLLRAILPAAECLKQGKLLVFDAQSKRWEPHSCSLTADGLGWHPHDKAGSCSRGLRFGTLDVPIEVLPDDARTSKQSKLFPVAVTFGNGRRMLLAAATGAEMWAWGIAIRRRYQGAAASEEERAQLRAALCAKMIPSGEQPSHVEEHAQFRERAGDMHELLLLGAPMDIESTGRTAGFTALHLACYCGAPKTMELLLAQGADVEQMFVTGPSLSFSPLSLLCWAPFTPGRVEMAGILLRAGANAGIIGVGSCIRALFKTDTSAGGMPIQADKQLAQLLLNHGAGNHAGDLKVRVHGWSPHIWL
jgi:hypothetical protein